MIQLYVLYNLLGLILFIIIPYYYKKSKSFANLFLLYTFFSSFFLFKFGLDLSLNKAISQYTYFSSKIFHLDLRFKVDLTSFLFLTLNFLLFLFIYLFRLYFIDDLVFHSFLTILYVINNFYFISGDPITLFLFWESMLVPTTLLLWYYSAGNSRRNALEYVIYNFGFSIFMLLGILLLVINNFYSQSGSISGIASFLIFIGIMVKSPVFPLHGWLENTYYNLPTFVTGIFSAILSKYAIYAYISLINTKPILYDPLLFIVATSIIISALIAISSDDFKKILVYMSMSHINVMVLGLLMLSSKTVTSLQVVLMSIVHGLVGFSLFLIVQYVQLSANDLIIKNYGNLTSQFPILTTVLTTALLILAGFPITAYFFSEFFILAATFKYSILLGFSLAFGISLNLIYKAKLFYYLIYKKYNVIASSKLTELSFSYSTTAVILLFSVLILTIYYAKLICVPN